jgi:hypothetical protein
MTRVDESMNENKPTFFRERKQGLLWTRYVETVAFPSQAVGQF